MTAARPHDMKSTSFFVSGHANRGFTLLLAALVSSIILAIGISIAELAKKSVTLSSVGRDSQFAFAAADTGSECALYWDVRYSLFQIGAAPSVGVPLKCATNDITVTVQTGVRSAYPYTLFFQIEPNGYCSRVYVTKAIDAITHGVKTTVDSDGYSTPCASIGTSLRTLQRSVELVY